jgi:hypothetical protein
LAQAIHPGIAANACRPLIVTPAAKAANDNARRLTILADRPRRAKTNLSRSKGTARQSISPQRVPTTCSSAGRRTNPLIVPAHN